MWYFLPSAEGFELTTFNVPYASKELFLVAPNIPGDPTFVNMYADSYTTSNNLQTSLYTNAYTRDEAQAKCVSFGATLATSDQLAIATNLGANWCIAGWAADGSLYAPLQKTCKDTKCSTICPNTVNNTTTVSGSSGSGSGSSNSNPELRKFTTNAPVKAYALCWGVKPPEPTVNVREFNKTDYSMVGTNILGAIMNGVSTELYPAQFTSEQAIYALEKTGYKDAATARTYLINNMGSANVNDKIYQTDPNYAEDGSNIALDPCVILANTRAKFHRQFEDLRKVFRDVSGAVIAMLGAKNENAEFAAKLQNICSQETPQSSPACAKLGTLDYNLLYSTSGSGVNLMQLVAGSSAGSSSAEWQVADTSTSRLAALEALNYFKFQREGELCTAYGHISDIETFIGCASAQQGSNAMGSECAYKDMGSKLGSITVMKNLDVNAEEFLKLRLKEIAPYFSSPNYASLVSGVINQLSLTIRLPSLNDFNSSNKNWDTVKDRIDSIASFFRAAMS